MTKKGMRVKISELEAKLITLSRDKTLLEFRVQQCERKLQVFGGYKQNDRVVAKTLVALPEPS